MGLLNYGRTDDQKDGGTDRGAVPADRGTDGGTSFHRIASFLLERNVFSSKGNVRKKNREKSFCLRSVGLNS